MWILSQFCWSNELVSDQMKNVWTSGENIIKLSAHEGHWWGTHPVSVWTGKWVRNFTGVRKASNMFYIFGALLAIRAISWWSPGLVWYSGGCFIDVCVRIVFWYLRGGFIDICVQIVFWIQYLDHDNIHNSSIGVLQQCPCNLVPGVLSIFYSNDCVV